MTRKIPTKANEPVTDEPSGSVEHFVKRFNAAWKRSAEAVLDVATTLVEAHDELSGKTFTWQGHTPYVRLDPANAPGHVLSLRRRS